jgi:hypothetical protein
MSTITAEATAAELLAELRELVNRYDGAATLDDVRQLADEVTARLRRARGRISRIVKAQAPPAPVVEPKPATEPAQKAAPLAEKKPPADAARVTTRSPSPPESAPPAATTPSARPAPRRTSFAIALAVLTVASSLWSTTSARARRTVRAVRSTSRRAGRLATAVRTALTRLGGAS